ncbi:hypothetical protein pipiens_013605 [Culex pipiens pipiens]|uniref:Uncharacterized protein n=1 Tax=Culex pipiens pipiens TaxID=38569 RepID=A0ABD1CXS4_CULPP
MCAIIVVFIRDLLDFADQENLAEYNEPHIAIPAPTLIGSIKRFAAPEEEMKLEHQPESDTITPITSPTAAKPKTQINRLTLPASSCWRDAYRKQLYLCATSPRWQGRQGIAQIKERGALPMTIVDIRQAPTVAATGPHRRALQVTEHGADSLTYPKKRRNGHYEIDGERVTAIISPLSPPLTRADHYRDNAITRSLARNAAGTEAGTAITDMQMPLRRRARCTTS